MSKVIQAVIFDFDGTLIESEGEAVESVLAVIAQLGLSPSAAELSEAISRVVGRKWEDSLQFLHQRFSVSLPLQEFSGRVLREFQQRMAKGPRVIPGVLSKIPWLAKKYPLALVSGSSRPEIIKVLQQLGLHGYFKLILGAEDYRQSKPSPEGYLKAAQLLGVDPAACLVFEDSAPGISSAIDAGMIVVAIRHAGSLGLPDGGPSHSLDQSRALDSIADFRELEEMHLLAWMSRRRL